MLARRPTRRELALVAAAMALAVALRIAYVWLTRGHALAGDELEYDLEGRFAADGRWLWTECCFGVPHESLQKAPAYPLWVSTWYALLGPKADTVLALQAFVAPATVALTWLLGRRLFAPRVGVAAAFVVAIAPNVWQYDVRLYSEVLATPLTLLVLLVVLDREPTWQRASLAGALLAANLYVRPSAVFLLAPIAVAWWIAAGWRRGTLYALAATGAAVLLVAPWTLRNRSVDPDHLVPISIQGAAAFGTFNDEAANDPVWPYKWRPLPASYRDLFDGPPLSDGALRAELGERTYEYIRHNPWTVPQAFFWNGVTRVWDLRRPARVLDSAPFEGRERGLAAMSLAAYWLMLPLALAALWRNRRNRPLVLPLLAAAVALSVVYSADGGTRYRAPVEPIIALLAAAAITGRRPDVRARGSADQRVRAAVVAG